MKHGQSLASDGSRVLLRSPGTTAELMPEMPRPGEHHRDAVLVGGLDHLIVAGVPLGTPGATNMVRIAFVGSDAAGD